LNQQNPKGVTTTQDYSFLNEASPIYVTSLSNNNNTVTSTSITTAKIPHQAPPINAKSPTVKSISNPIGDASLGNNNHHQHQELHQTNSTNVQSLTTSIIRKPITSATLDNKTAPPTNPSSSSIASVYQQQQLLTSNKQVVAGPSAATSSIAAAVVVAHDKQLTAINLTDPSDLIKNSASNVVNNNSINFHNNINVLNNVSSVVDFANNRTNEVISRFPP